MGDAELVRVLDYILNRCDEASIDVLAEAVVRRRRDLALFGNTLKMPDPQRFTKELSEKINEGINEGVKGLKESVRDMAIRIIRQEAPELTPEQIAELTRTWIPDDPKPGQSANSNMPPDLLRSMIDQFVSFSRGKMSSDEDRRLRDEMNAWPERYWKAFPPVIKSIITEFIKDKISESEFNSKIGIALSGKSV